MQAATWIKNNRNGRIQIDHIKKLCDEQGQSGL